MQQKTDIKFFPFLDNCICIRIVKLCLLTTWILVIGSQCVNKQS